MSSYISMVENEGILQVSHCIGQSNEYVFIQHPNLGMHQPEADSFIEKSYILQNGRSLSVTSEFTAIVRDNNRGVFIGAESGGFAMIRVPNTHLGLDILLPGYYMYRENRYRLDRGILPEHPVNLS